MTPSYPSDHGRTPRPADVAAVFAEGRPQTVGLEEELMLLDPSTLDLLPRAADVIERCEGDPRFKLELPAAQLEIVLPPTTTVAEGIAGLTAARRDLAAAADGIGLLAAAGVHPFTAPLGTLAAGERPAALVGEYRRIAQLQLVGALQVHVAVGGPERTLAVYNALRSHLPELAALAANAPFFAGVDTGLASVRPKLGELLPRQGVPPAIASWDAFGEDLDWGRAAGALPTTNHWWWELRPHLTHGTLELRVPDAQATVADAGAVAAYARCLAVWLGERHEAGELEPPAPTWRIEQNRWAACRDGLDAQLADLTTGVTVPARELVAERLATLAPTAGALRDGELLEDVRRLLDSGGGAERQRRAAADGGGARAAAAWLADAYAPAPAGVGT